MKYIVYLTLNTVNLKIYVGVHGTENPNKFDGYIGDGVYVNMPKTYNKHKTIFHSAVAKYGPSCFRRKTLKVFDTEQEALALESIIVDKEFIERFDTYNMVVGGGMPPKLVKSIYQYDLQGNYITQWESIKAITTHFNVNKDRIRMVINDKRSFNNSYWSEIKYDHLDTTNYRPSSRGFVRQYNLEGNLLSTFKNATEASNLLDIDRKRICSAISGKYSISGCWFLVEGEQIEDFLSGKIKQTAKIYQYSDTGEFLKEFDNLSAVKHELRINKNDLIRSIKNNNHFCGYIWSYVKYNNIINECPEYTTYVPKKVYQYTLDGEFIKEWDSINECKKTYPSVLQVLLGKRNHCRNFKFSFDKPMI